MKQKIWMEVEIDLNSLDEEQLIKFVEGTEYKLVEIEELEKFVAMRDVFWPLWEKFEKEDINKLQREALIELAVSTLTIKHLLSDGLSNDYYPI